MTGLDRRGFLAAADVAPAIVLGPAAPADAGTAAVLPGDTGGRRLSSLDVVAVRNWRRDTLFADTGLRWMLPSPNMPTPDTALLYPGTCMFEGTLLSEGRGTTRPFELIGAPGIDWRWADALNAADLPGSARLRTIDAGASAADVVGAWQAELTTFRQQRRPFLLYR